MKENFEKRLRTLHEVGNRLSRTESVEELCCSIVELGKSELGFDRLSIWFVGKNPRYLVGSFGVDEKGRLRKEIGEKVLRDDDPAVRHIHSDRAHSVLEPNVPLRNGSGKIVGRGAHIIATIWDGKRVVGYLSADNLLSKKPFNEHDREVLELFASTFGHLYSLKKAEEELKEAYGRLKDVQHQLIQSAKMEVVGSLASGAAHEVKNPLAIMLQGIEYIGDKVDASDSGAHNTLERMKRAVEKADNIIRGLLDFSAVSKLSYTPQNLNSIIEKALRLVSYDVEKSKIETVREFQKDLPDVRIDDNKIEQVLVNLFLNCIYQMPDGGKMTIRTYSKEEPKRGTRVVIEIEDTGSGIPDEIMDKIFNPFFTTRRASGGTGLGLAIVRNIMDMHEGKVELVNKKAGHGAKAILTFEANKRRRS